MFYFIAYSNRYPYFLPQIYPVVSLSPQTKGVTNETEYDCSRYGLHNPDGIIRLDSAANDIL